MVSNGTFLVPFSVSFFNPGRVPSVQYFLLPSGLDLRALKGPDVLHLSWFSLHTVPLLHHSSYYYY